jgi:hypothetical protein
MLYPIAPATAGIQEEHIMSNAKMKPKMIEVYQCKSWIDGQWNVNRGHFTREAIEAMRSTEIIPETEREVDEAELDGNGRVIVQD